MYVAKYMVLWFLFSFGFHCLLLLLFMAGIALLAPNPSKELTDALWNIAMTISPLAGAGLLLLYHQTEMKKLP